MTPEEMEEAKKLLDEMEEIVSDIYHTGNVTAKKLETIILNIENVAQLIDPPTDPVEFNAL